ncbi:MAG: hypothetical protein ACQ9MH_21880, partial [Nitrospinales bacterium]
MKGIISQDMLCERLIMDLLYRKMDGLEAHKNRTNFSFCDLTERKQISVLLTSIGKTSREDLISKESTKFVV